MKTLKLFTAAVLTLWSFTLMAQQGINYKALIKDNGGNVVANQNITVQFQILEGAGMVNVYQETHAAMTDANGIVIVNIGVGTPDSGDYNTIDWGSDNHFLNVQIDTGGGLTDMGTTQFMAVPYALNAAMANNVTGLEALDEGNGKGWRLIGRNPATYGNVGLNGVDLSFSPFTSSTRGATGERSTALGYRTTASGHTSTAMGAATFATGVASTSMGINSTASGDYSTVMGNNTIASGEAAVAMGDGTSSEGNYSTTAGYQTIAMGLGSTAMGYQTSAEANYSTALGINTSAQHGATALGSGTTASGSGSTAMGNNSTASGVNSTAMGNNTVASGPFSTAMGDGTLASDWYSTSMGGDTTASGGYSTAMGHETMASGAYALATGYNTIADGFGTFSMGLQSDAEGYYSAAFGHGTIAPSFASVAIGRFNYGLRIFSTNDWLDNDALFEIGIGEDNLNRNNAMTVLKNGNVGIGAYPPSTKLHIMGGSDATLSNESGYLVIGSESSTNLIFDNNEIMARFNGGSSNLFLQQDGGSVYVGGELVHSSDRSLKQDITSLSYGLNEILQLQPVTYHWKSNPDAKHKTIGLIAQEVQPLLKELVKEARDNDKLLSLNYEGLIPVLINAIKEQQEIIAGQETQIKSLSLEVAENKKDYNKRIESLLNRVQQIEHSMNQ